MADPITLGLMAVAGSAGMFASQAFSGGMGNMGSLASGNSSSPADAPAPLPDAATAPPAPLPQAQSPTTTAVQPIPPPASIPGRKGGMQSSFLSGIAGAMPPPSGGTSGKTLLGA